MPLLTLPPPECHLQDQQKDSLSELANINACTETNQSQCDQHFLNDIVYIIGEYFHGVQNLNSSRILSKISFFPQSYRATMLVIFLLYDH